jgi:hypothetical protein
MYKNVNIYYFTKLFKTFERFFMILLSKYIFLDFLLWYVYWAIFYLRTYKKTKEAFFEFCISKSILFIKKIGYKNCSKHMQV